MNTSEMAGDYTVGVCEVRKHQEKGIFDNFKKCNRLRKSKGEGKLRQDGCSCMLFYL